MTELELNKPYTLIWVKLGIGRDFINTQNCEFIEKIPYANLSAETLKQYEAVRLQDRHKFPKTFDYALKGIVHAKSDKILTILFVQTRYGSWESLDNFRSVVDIDGTLLTAYLKTEK